MNKNREDIIRRIGQERYEHSLRVMNTAIELSRIHSIDENKAKIAAIYHDCGKIKDIDKLFKECEKYKLVLTEDMKKAPQIIHSYLGALIAKEKYNITDEDILKAIRYHTTGKDNMTDLEKVIFLSDMIEPKRNFDGVEEIRKACKVDLDRAIYLALNHSIIYLCTHNTYIAFDSIKARNFYWR